jgi:hypothetical protein
VQGPEGREFSQSVESTGAANYSPAALHENGVYGSFASQLSEVAAER